MLAVSEKKIIERVLSIVSGRINHSVLEVYGRYYREKQSSLEIDPRLGTEYNEESGAIVTVSMLPRDC